MGDGGRRGHWFPLVLFGFGLLGLLAWDSVGPGQDFGWVAYAPTYDTGHAFQTADNTVLQAYFNTGLPAGIGWYPFRDWSWLVLVTVTLVVTAAWYGWRARRTGDSVRTHVAVAVGGGLAVPAMYVVAGMAGMSDDPTGVITSVGLPLLLLGGVAAAWGIRRDRRVVAVAGAVFLVVGVGTVLGAWSLGLLAPVLVAGGLLALARFERSRLVAVVAAAVLVAMVVFPHGTLSMLIPAAITLAAGIVVLVRQGAPA